MVAARYEAAAPGRQSRVSSRFRLGWSAPDLNESEALKLWDIVQIGLGCCGSRAGDVGKRWQALAGWSLRSFRGQRDTVEFVTGPFGLSTRVPFERDRGTSYLHPLRRGTYTRTSAPVRPRS